MIRGLVRGSGLDGESAGSVLDPSDNGRLRRLGRLPIEQFERAAQRLEQRDLLTLARFASPPHVLVHYVIAALHHLLLSISLANDTTSGLLHVPPWPLLRLDVLTRIDAIWRKIGTRLASLRRPLNDPRRKPLANAQVHFVVEYVMKMPLLSDVESWVKFLDAVSRVSAIAESIAAYVILCAHYSLVPPAVATVLPSKSLITCPESRSPIRLQRMEPLQSPRELTLPAPEKIHRSWRCGLKHHGQFFLFHATVNGSTDRPTGNLSALALVCHHAVFQWNERVSAALFIHARCCRNSGNAYAGAWSKRMLMPPPIMGLVTAYYHKSHHLSSEAALSLLLQASVAAALFSRPPLGLRSPSKRLPPCVRGAVDDTAAADLRVSIRVLVFTAEVPNSILEATALTLVAIGAIETCGLEVTLSDLRKQLVACGCSLRSRPFHLSSSAFRFFLDGMLVAIDDESCRRIVELLPCAFVCLITEPSRQQERRHKPEPTRHWRRWFSVLSHLSHVVGRALAKQLPSLSETVLVVRVSRSLTVTLYSLEQIVASFPSSSPSSSSSLVPSSVSSTINTLLTLFIDWSAFVQFQQLQDTSTILHEHGFPHKPKRILQPRPADSILSNAADDAKFHAGPTPAELELMFLPHRHFRPEKEYLRPLYASFNFRTRGKAHLNSPCLAELMEELNAASETSPIRLAVENDECVIHVSSVSLKEDGSHDLVVRYARDRSCPLEMIMTMQHAYVWAITPLANGTTEANKESMSPPRWVRDVLRFVVHPTWDFRSPESEMVSPSTWPFPRRFFHVNVPYFEIEQTVEKTQWSRGIDWWPHWRACDVERDLLRPAFDAMRDSFPAGISIDSTKFSKFLHKCGLQPAHLSVGDAAFLFTTHRARGSHYEMDYDGFADAMRWIARRVGPPPPQCSRDAPAQQQPLHDLCSEWLLRALSMQAIWKGVVDQWRLVEKWRYMEQAAIEYCAVTRIRANWKRLLTRRALLATLTRLKKERRTAAKLQSLYKMRKVRRDYTQLKACVLKTQRFVRARRELRQLRVERARLVETMRQRLQKWMRKRLRVLRCWMAINAAWLARRARIREKRGRLVWASAYLVESRLFRASLYRVPLPSLPPSTVSDDDSEYELELLEPTTSWFRSIRVSQCTLDNLSLDALKVPSASTPAKDSDSREKNRWKLLVLMQRLCLKARRPFVTNRQLGPRGLVSSSWRQHDSVVQIYRDPMDTSLGRLVFQGSVQVHSLYTSTAAPTSCFVRLHLRAHEFTLVTYSPEPSTKYRYMFATLFVYRLFQVAGWHRLQVLDEDESRGDDEMVSRSFAVDALGVRGDRLLATRLLLRYLVCHGTTPPTRDLMPDAVERRAREQLEREERVHEARVRRQLSLVVMVQSAVRRVLAIRHVQRVAQRSYTKALDPIGARLVYRHRRTQDVLSYEEKPHSLREKDVVDPVDEWILSGETSLQKRYFNPLRGAFSRWNDVEAAVRLQRWFRRAMWTRGFPTWDLRCLTQAMVFHHHVQVPSDATDRRHLEQITNYAYQRHVLHHDYKTASTYYEAACKLDPDHVPALVGLAVLLIYSCPYPVKQTWSRGLELLDQASRADPCLSTSLMALEQNCFRWAMFLHPNNANVFGNYAVFRQCVRGDLDHAELLYRRAIDLEAGNESVVENYLRLQRERSPEGIYCKAGPSKIAVWRAQETRRLPNSDWRELEDTSARLPSAKQFFQNVRTGLCTWTLPDSETARSTSPGTYRTQKG